MLNPFLRAVTYLVTASMLFTGMPAPLPQAMASPLVAECTNVFAAERGYDANCAVRRLSDGTLLAYPKLQWERISDAPAVPGPSGAGLAPSQEALALANRAAVSLKLPSSEVASAVQAFPSNVPLVFARYNPMDMTLSIDLFKVERAVVGGEARAGVYHAKFGPGHGDAWRAAGAYAVPAARETGAVGLNPFAAFKSPLGCPVNYVFCNITLSGAQVAVGHAMRYAGAPMSLVAINKTRSDTSQTKSGNAFVKKITTTVTGYAKPLWLIGYPAQFQARSASLPMATMCANDPRSERCPAYQVASAGVVFEEYEGGTLAGYEDSWELFKETKSGLGWLSVLVVAVVVSFATAGIGAAAGVGVGAAGGAGAAGAAGVATGVLGSYAVAAGYTIGSLAASIAVETALIGSLMALGGADLSAGLKFGMNAVYGQVETVKGWGDKPPQGDMDFRLNLRVHPLTHNDIHVDARFPGLDQKPLNSLSAFGATFQGKLPTGPAAAGVRRPERRRAARRPVPGAQPGAVPAGQRRQGHPQRRARYRRRALKAAPA